RAFQARSIARASASFSRGPWSLSRRLPKLPGSSGAAEPLARSGRRERMDKLCAIFIGRRSGRWDTMLGDAGARQVINRDCDLIRQPGKVCGSALVRADPTATRRSAVRTGPEERPQHNPQGRRSLTPPRLASHTASVFSTYNAYGLSRALVGSTPPGNVKV